MEKLTEFLENPPEHYNVAFVPTAADPYQDRGFVEADRKALVKAGFKVIDLDIKGKTKTRLLNELKAFNLVFVAGGNSFYLLQEAKRAGFDLAVKQLVSKGVIYVGSSAGAVIAGSDIEMVKYLDNPEKAPLLKEYKGLGLVDKLILPHYGNTKYTEGYLKMLKEFPDSTKQIKIGELEAITFNNGIMKIV